MGIDAFVADQPFQLITNHLKNNKRKETCNLHILFYNTLQIHAFRYICWLIFVLFILINTAAVSG